MLHTQTYIFFCLKILHSHVIWKSIHWKNSCEKLHMQPWTSVLNCVQVTNIYCEKWLEIHLFFKNFSPRVGLLIYFYLVLRKFLFGDNCFPYICKKSNSLANRDIFLKFPSFLTRFPPNSSMDAMLYIYKEISSCKILFFQNSLHLQ